MRVRVAAVAALAGLLAAPTPARAWSNKEHIQLTRLAVEELLADSATPPAMRDWLKAALPSPLDAAAERDYFLRQRVGLIPRGVDGLPYWAVVPDMNALLDREDKRVEPFGVHERLLHYIDLELFMPETKDRAYAHDLSHKPKLADVPRALDDPRWRQAGLLPWRVEGCYRQLVASLRAGRLNDAPGQFPRDDHAAKWAGFLAHYAEDNTQPQHATIDYKSHAYFADKRRGPNVHWDVEGRLMDDEFADYPKLREEFWAAFTRELAEFNDPVRTADPWQATLEVSLTSYDALPLIGTAAMSAYGQAGTPTAPEGSPKHEFDADAFFHAKGSYLGRDMTVLEMKAHQMAWAVKRVEKLWRQAWDEATRQK